MIDLRHKTILVTGSAGFIGRHISQLLLDSVEGVKVIGVDNLNSYYSPQLKADRLNTLTNYPQFEFIKGDISDKDLVEKVFLDHSIDIVCHLAAQVGVRYSVVDPYAYVKSNQEGFLNVLHCAKNHGIKNFVYASSSSVYGGNDKFPFSEDDPVEKPISFYAATKRSNELTAYSYSQLYKIPTTGLRLFTVYGPWGRPDMAIFSFTQKIAAGLPIQVFGQGKLVRDFTYVDDIVQGIIAALGNPRPFRVYNLGAARPINLHQLISLLEQNLDKKAIIEYKDRPLGDVDKTHSDISKAQRELGYNPKVSSAQGIKQFVQWYRHYYSSTSSPQPLRSPRI